MTRGFPILLLVSLMGCAKLSTQPDLQATIPVPPPLTSQLAQPCPPAPLLQDNAIGTLVTSDAALAYDYARCSASKQSVVEIYNQVREGLIKFNDSLVKKP